MTPHGATRMCDFGTFFSRAFTAPGTGGAEAANETAMAAANNALLAQKQAQDQATASADSASETDQLAREATLRKLAAAGSFGSAYKGSFGAPNVATRQLFGAAA